MITGFFRKRTNVVLTSPDLTVDTRAQQCCDLKKAVDFTFFGIHGYHLISREHVHSDMMGIAIFPSSALARLQHILVV